MARVSVVSHATIDHILSNNREVITAGGPVCYSGLFIRQLHDMIPITKVGCDFMDKRVDYIRCNSIKPTTRFRLEIYCNKRRLFLLARCEDITDEDIRAVLGSGFDASVVSPVIGEVDPSTIRLVAGNSGFTMLDPQGLVRSLTPDNECYVKYREINIGDLHVDAIKVDRDEAYALTASHTMDALSRLASHVDIAILTIDNTMLMHTNGHIYTLTIEHVKDSVDSTGVGDIFTAAYTSAYIKDRDAVWALSYAASSAYLALKSKRFGVSKVPNPSETEEQAYSFSEQVRLTF